MSDTDNNGHSLEYSVLKIMKDAAGPTGAGSLRELLEVMGINISEAGIGRTLRLLRKNGTLARVGFQGHIITPSGLERLAALENICQVYKMLTTLLHDMGPMRKYNILDILSVRRALECEAATQAALKATQEDIERVENIVAEQYRVMEKNEDYADLSTAFHREVMRIANVPLLKDLYECIGLSVKWQNFFIGTFKMYNQPLNISHEKILQAIKERDPQKAFTIMYCHLSTVIENARNLITPEETEKNN